MKCPYRYINKGRTFCSLALAEGKYYTTEVSPEICAPCLIPELVRRVPCAYLDLGLAIIGFYTGAKIEEYFATCRARCERLQGLTECSRECADFALSPRLANFLEREVDRD